MGSDSGSLPSSGVTNPATCMVLGNDGDIDSAAVSISIAVLAAGSVDAVADAFTIDENRNTAVSGNLLTGAGLTAGVTGNLRADMGGMAPRTIAQAEVVATAATDFTGSAAAPTDTAGQYTFGANEGSLQLSNTGAFTYTPGTAFNSLAAGADRELFLRYRAQDSAGTPNTDDAVLTITVTGVNDAPMAMSDSLTMTELGGSVRLDEGDSHTFAPSHFDFSDADTVPAQDALERVNISAVSGGSLALNGVPYSLNSDISAGSIGNLVFTPENRGADYDATITYTVHDGDDPSVGSATLTIPVAADNDAPTVQGAGIPDGQTVTVGGAAFSYTITAEGTSGAEFDDVDDGDALSYSLPTSGVTPANPSWLSITGGDTITGSPPAGTMAETITVTVRATDSGSPGLSIDDTFTLVITAAALAPPNLANANAARLTVGTMATITFTNSGGTLTMCAVTGAPLPAGLTASRTTGDGSCQISGTPAAAATAATYTVTATNASGSNSATVDITVNKADQAALSFGTPTTTVAVGGTVTNVATGGSGMNAISYSSDDSTVARVDASTGQVTGVAAGSTVITATRQGDATYNDATPVRYTITVTDPGKTNQTGFGFSSPTMTVAVGGTVTNTATGGQSTGAISYRSSATGVATVNMTTGQVTGVSVGTSVITATKMGDATYNDATDMYTITVTKGAQAALSFGAPTTTVAVGGTVTNVATGGSGTSAISYSSDDSTVARVDANTGQVTGVAAGSTVITASKVGDANYNDATPVRYTITVTKADQAALSFGTPTTTVAVGGTVTNVATGGSGMNAISYSSDDSTVARVDASTGQVTGVAAGSTVITATRQGDATYNDATPVRYTITVTDPGKTNQTGFGFSSPTMTVAVGGTVTNTATGGQSTGAISYRSSATGVATVNMTTGQVTGVSVGSSVITAIKMGDATYNDATDMYTITVTAATPTLAAPNLANANAASLTVGTMATITFTNSGGGSLTGCSVTGAPLPAGLTASRTTGDGSCQITGTPNAPATAATYTVTATNAIGSANATVSITVAAATTTTPPMTEAQVRAVRNRDTQETMTQVARTLSLGAVSTVRQRISSLGSGGARGRQPQVSLDVLGLVDLAISKGDGFPGSGGSSGSLDFSGLASYVMSRAGGSAQPAEEEPSEFFNESQVLNTNAFIAGLSDSASGAAIPDEVTGHVDLATLGEGLVNSAVGGRGGDYYGDMRFWASAEHGEISSSPRSGLNFSDDTTIISLGMERQLGDDKLVGVAASWLKGEPSFTDTTLGARGETELEQWSIIPYVATSIGSARVWGSIGMGAGRMHYSDTRMGTRDSTSVSTGSLLYAAGAEYDVATLAGLDLLVRGEVSGASMRIGGSESDMFDASNVNSRSVRGELEAGYSIYAGQGHYRPYVTVGYRADGGDSGSDNALEYGGGLLIGTEHLTVIASARFQSSTGGSSGNDRTSYALELAYDRHQDGEGLNLNVRNSIDRVDSYSYGAPASSSMRSLMNMRIGYGQELGNWMLTPYAEADLDGGRMARWTIGVGANLGIGTLELTHTAHQGTGRSDGLHESLLQLNVDFQ